MIEKISEKFEFGKKNIGFYSVIFIFTYMFYVAIISLLINFALEKILEPLSILFKSKTIWDLEFWIGIISIMEVYTILNIVMIYASYKTVFRYGKISKEKVAKFLFVIAIIFPVGLFTISYLTEKEAFPLILNTLSQIGITYLLRNQIRLKEEA